MVATGYELGTAGLLVQHADYSGMLPPNSSKQAWQVTLYVIVKIIHCKLEKFIIMLMCIC